MIQLFQHLKTKNVKGLPVLLGHGMLQCFFHTHKCAPGFSSSAPASTCENRIARSRDYLGHLWILAFQNGRSSSLLHCSNQPLWLSACAKSCFNREDQGVQDLGGLKPSKYIVTYCSLQRERDFFGYSFFQDRLDYIRWTQS